MSDTTAAVPGPELLPGADVALGGPRGLPVVRTLPNRRRRTVGAWCFVDAYGPHRLAAGPGMQVGPHPHAGLQTVSWLVAGEIVHRDSLGNTCPVRPGELSLMTAGHGIAHSERTPAAPGPDHRPGVLHGVQLWVALPGADRAVAPAFAHHAGLPTVELPGLSATVVMGELLGAASPARCHTPLVGAELRLAAGADLRLPLRPDFEHALLALDGAATVAGTRLGPGPLCHLGEGRRAVPLAADGPARLLLIGGEPFTEPLVMWWNFVAREHEEVVAARADWAAGRRFGPVAGDDGPRLPAPPMPTTRLVPRGRLR